MQPVGYYRNPTPAPTSTEVFALLDEHLRYLLAAISRYNLHYTGIEPIPRPRHYSRYASALSSHGLWLMRLQRNAMAPSLCTSVGTMLDKHLRDRLVVGS